MNNKLLIVNNVEKVIRGDYTDFLYPNELNLVISNLNKQHIKYNIFKPFNDSEKNIIYKDNYPKVSLIEIISDNKINHKDILGSLFSHNININKYGDIIITDKYYLIILDIIKPYILSNLNKIGNNFVKLKEVDINLISNYKYKYEEKQILVSSLRLDNIVSSLTNTSRNNVDLMFKEKHVYVNYINNKKTYIVKENDIIGIRKNGKYKFINVLKITNKNKYIVKLLKYK